MTFFDIVILLDLTKKSYIKYQSTWKKKLHKYEYHETTVEQRNYLQMDFRHMKYIKQM